MRFRLHGVTAALFVALSLIMGAHAGASAGSDWVESLRSQVRLVEGGAGVGSDALAGIEIELDPGFKTYWRHPGESGLPPSFDWRDSENLREAEVLWPAPSRFEDAGGVSYGYGDRVLLPVKVTATDATKPVRLALKLDYGVCRDICIPVSAEMKLDLVRKGPTPHRASIGEALARVPTPKPLGAAGELSILAVEPKIVDGKGMIAISLRSPSEPTLFIEAPEGWYVAAEPSRTRHWPGGEGIVLAEILERPRDGSRPIDLRLTALAEARAIETVARLDTAQLPR
jgi:DsbC/DsbD-like thiol-disulfide interchange protein